MLHMNKQNPVLVTGGSGYLALWLIKILLEQGFNVRTTVRDKTQPAKVAHLNTLAQQSGGKLEIFCADLMVADSFAQAMQNCTVVFHVASPFVLNSQEDAAQQVIAPALTGTENVLACVNRAHSVKRVVLTSSVVAMIGDNRDINMLSGGQLSERCWNSTSSATHQPYSYAKTLAEKAAWKIAKQQPHWDLVVLNPGFMLGPSLSQRVDSTSISTMVNMANGKYRWGVPQLYNGIVDVRDVAQAHFLAGLDPNASGRHILVNETLSLLDIAKMLQQHFPTGYRFAQRELPKWLMWLLAPAIGRSRQYVSQNFNIPISFDNSRSIRALNLSYRPIKQTLTEHLQQLIDDKLVE
jgi:nucleoside-diphosphate-sugar epimerase